MPQQQPLSNNRELGLYPSDEESDDDGDDDVDRETDRGGGTGKDVGTDAGGGGAAEEEAVTILPTRTDVEEALGYSELHSSQRVSGPFATSSSTGGRGRGATLAVRSRLLMRIN